LYQTIERANGQLWQKVRDVAQEFEKRKLQFRPEFAQGRSTVSGGQTQPNTLLPQREQHVRGGGLPGSEQDRSSQTPARPGPSSASGRQLAALRYPAYDSPSQLPQQQPGYPDMHAHPQSAGRQSQSAPGHHQSGQPDLGIQQARELLEQQLVNLPRIERGPYRTINWAHLINAPNSQRGQHQQGASGPEDSLAAQQASQLRQRSGSPDPGPQQPRFRR
jgi:hypothetical protein